MHFHVKFDFVGFVPFPGWHFGFFFFGGGGGRWKGEVDRLYSMSLTISRQGFCVLMSHIIYELKWSVGN